MANLVQKPRDGIERLPSLPRQGEYLTNEEREALAEMGLGSMLRSAGRAILKGALKGAKGMKRVAQGAQKRGIVPNNNRRMQSFNAAQGVMRGAKNNPNAPRVLSVPSQVLAHKPVVAPRKMGRGAAYGFADKSVPSAAAGMQRQVMRTKAPKAPIAPPARKTLMQRVPLNAPPIKVNPAATMAAPKINTPVPKAPKIAKMPKVAKAPKLAKAPAVKKARIAKVKVAKVKAPPKPRAPRIKKV